MAALPERCAGIVVLTHEGARGAGEPLYQDVVTSLAERCPPGARGSRVACRACSAAATAVSKEFTPAMAKAALDELSALEPERTSRSGSPTT